MTKRNIDAEILDGINEIKNFKQGKRQLKTTECTELSSFVKK